MPPAHAPRVLVVGATGYTGRELTLALRRHPSVELVAACSARQGAEPPPPAHPGEPTVLPYDDAWFGRADVAFLATPHGTSVELATRALDAGARVVDLSADFRLSGADAYRRVYGAEHGAPALLGEAVYALVERARAKLPDARLAAGPGCYPTSVLLPLLPLVERGALAPGSVVVANCASGVSGAGKAPTETTLFGNVEGNYRAYGVGNHRHQPEIQQEVERAARAARQPAPEVVFVPHLLPAFRGILATIYLEPAEGVDAAAVLAALREAYAGEPFVFVSPSGLPSLADVVHTNRCHVGVAAAGSRIVVVSAIDNLLKGAAGQAIQAMNCMLGLPETDGLALDAAERRAAAEPSRATGARA